VREQTEDFLARHGEALAPYGPRLTALLRERSLVADTPELEECEPSLRQILGQRDDFNRIRTYAHEPKDLGPELQYQAQVAYRRFLPFQGPTDLMHELWASEAELRSAVQQYRSNASSGPDPIEQAWDRFAHGKSLTSRIETWQSLNELAQTILPLHQKMVTLRNRLAREQGFDHHLHYSLYLHELDDPNLSELLDQAVIGSNHRMEVLKAELDRELAERFRTGRSNLRSWHYEHPLRLLRPWHRLEQESAFGRRSLTAAKVLCSRLDLPRVAFDALPCLSTNHDPTPWELASELGSALYKIVGLMFEGQRDPSLRATDAHPVLIFTLWWLMMDQVSKTSVLSESLGLDSQAALRFRAAFAMQFQRENLICVRDAAKLLAFERELYRHPGQKLGTTYWDGRRAAFQVDERDQASSVWAASLELLRGNRPWLIQALGVLVGSQLAASLPPSPPGRTLFHHPQSREILQKHLLIPACLRPWQETVRAICGGPLLSAAFLR
jgi:peptidyl-dipeptidase A